MVALHRLRFAVDVSGVIMPVLRSEKPAWLRQELALRPLRPRLKLAGKDQ
ncbi:MAG: hypothetical protein ACO34E_01740 [Limisphaerales bacterium]